MATWSDNIFTGQHFGDEGNRAKLMGAMNAGLIDERDYKLMSGYDASQEMGLTPYQTLQASGIYNTAKGVMSPQDFEGKIGPIRSSLLNTIGSTGYGIDKDKYSGITGLNLESLREDPYGSSLGAQTAQRLGIAPVSDFDYPTGEAVNLKPPFGEDTSDLFGAAAFGEDTSDLSGMAEVQTPQGLDTTRFQDMYGGPGQGEEAENYYTTGEGVTSPDRWRNFLSKVTRQPYRGAQRHTRDFTPTQLNRMNALGGRYSEPLRQQRRERSRVADLLARQAAEKSYSQAI